MTVRFGNVLGSAGSVIPVFREQICAGRADHGYTPGHDARYFMTIPEASQLVLQAGAMGNGGEIYILDMGEPVRIVDLAHDLITLSGLRPNDDIEICFTGVRPGEKLIEELCTDAEHADKTKHPKVYIGRIKPHVWDVVVAGVGTALEPAVVRTTNAFARHSAISFQNIARRDRCARASAWSSQSIERRSRRSQKQSSTQASFRHPT